MAKKAVKKSPSDTTGQRPSDDMTEVVASSAVTPAKGSKGGKGGAESDLIKVNTSSLVELKNACDDAVKAYFGRPTAFTRSHVHEDVRLALGWSSIIVAAVTGYHAYMVPFHESKGWVAVGVAIYAMISAMQAYYTRYIEKDIIFTGKRRTFASRISTETMTISSRTVPPPSPLAFLPFLPSNRTPAALAEASKQPTYTLVLKYVHSSNGGKALIHESEKVVEKGFGEFFDKEGTMWKVGFERMLEGIEREVVGQ